MHVVALQNVVDLYGTRAAIFTRILCDPKGSMDRPEDFVAVAACGLYGDEDGQPSQSSMHAPTWLARKSSVKEKKRVKRLLACCRC